jgi:hypothetical protein
VLTLDLDRITVEKIVELVGNVGVNESEKITPAITPLK